MTTTEAPTKNRLMGPAQQFVDKVRALFADRLEETALWQQIGEELRTLLASSELQARTGTWPDTKIGNGPPSNLLFYEDPDYGFVLNALVKSPDSVTFVHDHGPSWTLYGVLEGGEHIERYRRVDDHPVDSGPAELEHEGAFDVTPGYIDVVPPWQIHQEKNGDHRTIGFIVRSQRSGTFPQYRYNMETGEVMKSGGPTQIPFALN
jgi:predicted metal-dependent enzyme (double-stranded beta helix superfamily)